jgi:alkylated DNA repair dioxygenase AlkB
MQLRFAARHTNDANTYLESGRIIEHMDGLLQGSLLDLTDAPGLGPLDQIERTQLAGGAWVDFLAGWLRGADELFERLLHAVPWRAERRRMYERVVDVPRLLCFYDADATLPDPLLAQARDALDAHYADELGEQFVTAGLCLYRDGRDSVAWHGDTIGRGSTHDTMVAILSLGTPRPLLLRPVGGGAAARYDVGHGDLLVMGGSCQRTWQHSIPKSARPTGPRISVQFRPRDVR